MAKHLWIFMVPVACFGVLTLLLWALWRENPDELPSALLNDQAPPLPTAQLTSGPAPTAETLRAPGVKLVNFWASWCGPCRVEHPTLMDLAQEGIQIIGVNYKDQPDNAKAFLEELGDPYSHIGVDANGRVGLDWGLYGVPETFLVDEAGKILLRHPGPVTQRVLANRIRPILEQAAEP